MKGWRGAALAALLGVAPVAALAQAVAPPPVAPLPPDEARAVYAEAVQTHDGFIYSVNAVRYTTEEQARKVWDVLQQPPNRVRRFTQIFPKLQTRNAFLFTYDPAVRARLVNMEENERSGVIRAATGGWYIVELVGTRPSGPLQQESLEKALPGLVAAGLLPSAAQLQSEPELRMRTQANRIQTVSDLGVAAGLDVNQRLSNEGTLLLRAILTDRRDLLEALLKRGANPNVCARKFCPVTLAIFRKQPQTVDLLLKAGASPNQTDPAKGIIEGPLNAAAYVGDLELAGRLIAGGAKVNGEGDGETPLMAAASAGNRPMVEFLVSRGADPLAVGALGIHRQMRGLLESANSTKNADFISWVRKLMLDTARKSGDYAWQGWVQQDGRRIPIDGTPVTLKRAPFSIIVRMKPDANLYVATSVDRVLFDEFARQSGDGALRSAANTSIEGEAADWLAAYEPRGTPKPDHRWGVAQNWFKRADHSRFAAVHSTPQGLEHVRQVRQLILMNNDDDKNVEVPVADFKGGALYMILGTRVRMTFLEDEVFDRKNLEIRFQ